METLSSWTWVAKFTDQWKWKFKKNLQYLLWYLQSNDLYICRETDLWSLHSYSVTWKIKLMLWNYYGMIYTQFSLFGFMWYVYLKILENMSKSCEQSIHILWCMCTAQNDHLEIITDRRICVHAFFFIRIVYFGWGSSILKKLPNLRVKYS